LKKDMSRDTFERLSSEGTAVRGRGARWRAVWIGGLGRACAAAETRERRRVTNGSSSVRAADNRGKET